MKIKQIVSYLFEEEVVDHFLSGVWQGLVPLIVFLLLSSGAMGQEVAPKGITLLVTTESSTTYFRVKGSALVLPSGKNSDDASYFYEQLWKKVGVIKSIVETGSENPVEFSIEFAPGIAHEKGVGVVRETLSLACMCPVAVVPGVSQKEAKLSIGVLDSPAGIAATVTFNFSLVKEEDELTIFAEELLEAIAADTDMKITRPPKSKDGSNSFVVTLPLSKYEDMKETVIDHLEKSGYKVVFDQ